MTRDKKKDNELIILRGVYGKKKTREYTMSERPDFVIHGIKNFGVEVTELYMDETGARLHNKQGYVNDVVTGKYIHKDDRGELEVLKTLEVFDEKKNRWKKISVQAVRQENKSAPERIAKLVSKINEKSEQAKTYMTGLRDIDLIVHDSRSSLLNGTEDQFIRNSFLQLLNRKVFAKSSYRNIYLSLPTYKNGKNEQPEIIVLK